MKLDRLSRIVARITGESLVMKNTGRFTQPTHDEIARLAHTLYIARDRSDGDDVADWLQAERELMRHYR